MRTGVALPINHQRFGYVHVPYGTLLVQNEYANLGLFANTNK